VDRTALVAIGGVAGSVARYWLSGAVQTLTDGVFPFGTLAVNVIGSFVVALVMALSLERGLIGPNLRLLLTVGFCGGFTTMSTFGYETVALLRDGQRMFALVNVTATLGATLVAVWLGGVITRFF